MTDAERIAELEEALRQRDARIAELERVVGELSSPPAFRAVPARMKRCYCHVVGGTEGGVSLVLRTRN